MRRSSISLAAILLFACAQHPNASVPVDSGDSGQSGEPSEPGEKTVHFELRKVP
jgi:hypothetical protein